MTPRSLWDIQLEMPRRQFRGESGLEKVLESIILPTALDICFRKSWRCHQELSSKPRLQPYISHVIQPKPLPHPASFCRAPIQGEHGRGTSLGDVYLAQWTGALAS